MLIPTVKLELSLESAPSCSSDPLVVAEPVVPPKVALSDSEKPSAAAVFSMVKSCSETSFSRTFPKTTELVTFAAERRNAVPVISSDWPATFSKLLVRFIDWPTRSPTRVAAKFTSRSADSLPVATRPRFDEVTPDPLSWLSVMLPPLAPGWIATRKSGPVVPVLPTRKLRVSVSPTRVLPKLRVAVAVLPPDKSPSSSTRFC